MARGKIIADFLKRTCTSVIASRMEPCRAYSPFGALCSARPCDFEGGDSPDNIDKEMDPIFPMLHRQNPLRSERPIIVSIEGNIGSGKSTLLNFFMNNESVEAVHEPLDKWTNLNGHNPLNLLYTDANRYSFSFNLYAALTRVQMHQAATKKPILMIERSLYSTRYCFIESSYKCGKVNGVEYYILCQWLDYLTQDNCMPVDLFVYLRADPEKCYQRLKSRSRKEEVFVPYSLIEDLHNFHEDWLIHKKKSCSSPVLVLDANTELPDIEKVYTEHQSQILFDH